MEVIILIKPFNNRPHLITGICCTKYSIHSLFCEILPSSSFHQKYLEVTITTKPFNNKPCLITEICSSKFFIHVSFDNSSTLLTPYLYSYTKLLFVFLNYLLPHLIILLDHSLDQNLSSCQWFILEIGNMDPLKISPLASV